LKSIARHVTGFDLPPMIARCREVAPDHADVLFDDWPVVRREHFDLVFASLVFQHIEPNATRAYLADIASMTPATYLLTRGQSDFEANVIDLIASLGLFEIDGCVAVEHDPRRINCGSSAASRSTRRSAPATWRTMNCCSLRLERSGLDRLAVSDCIGCRPARARSYLETAVRSRQSPDSAPSRFMALQSTWKIVAC